MGWFSGIVKGLKNFWSEVGKVWEQTGKKVAKWVYDKDGVEHTITQSYSRNYKVAGITYNDSFIFSYTTTQPTMFNLSTSAGDIHWNRRKGTAEAQLKYAIRVISNADTKYKLGLSYDELNSAVQASVKSAIDNDASRRTKKFSLIAGLIGFIPILNFFSNFLFSATAFVASFIGESKGQEQNKKLSKELMRQSILSAQIFRANIRQNEQEYKQKSDLLSNYIIYSSYDIYANGAVFKRGAAGSQSFCASSAFDTSKGIYASNLPDNTIDDMIALRYGGVQAGGFFFHNQILNIDFLRAEIDNTQNFNQIYTRRFKDFLSRINGGFVALMSDFTYYSEKDKVNRTINAYFNADGLAEQKYKRVLNTQTAYIKKQIINNDFLDKLKNYSKNLMADFDYLKMSDFDKKSKNSTPETYIPSYDEEFLEMMDDESIDVYIRAFAYINEFVNKFNTLKDLSATQHIKITKDEQRLEAVLDEQNALVLAGDLSQSDILDGFFKGGKDFTGDNILSLFKNDFVVKFQKEDLYKGGNVLAFYEFMVSDESCVYMKKDEYDRFIKAPYLPETMKDYDFSQIIIEQNV